MAKAFLVLLLNFCCILIYAQPEVPNPTDKVSRPKLVVGIVVDQMRWDYLYRYYDRYDPKGGFKRLIANNS